jgi:hypothetical protein
VLAVPNDAGGVLVTLLCHNFPYRCSSCTLSSTYTKHSFHLINSKCFQFLSRCGLRALSVSVCFPFCVFCFLKFSQRDDLICKSQQVETHTEWTPINLKHKYLNCKNFFNQFSFRFRNSFSFCFRSHVTSSNRALARDL